MRIAERHAIVGPEFHKETISWKAQLGQNENVLPILRAGSAAQLDKRPQFLELRTTRDLEATRGERTVESITQEQAQCVKES